VEREEGSESGGAAIRDHNPLFITCFLQANVHGVQIDLHGLLRIKNGAGSM